MRNALALVVVGALLVESCAEIPTTCGEGAPWPAGINSALASDLEGRLGARMEQFLSTERNVPRHPNELLATQKYIVRELKALRLEVDVMPAPPTEGTGVGNVEAVIQGLRDDGQVVLGAHFDSARMTPGANDNGSGVAALLEIATLVAADRRKRTRTLRLVFFTNEEEPYFGKEMGSRYYASDIAGIDVGLMISFETMAYYTVAPRSQCLFPVPGAWRSDPGPMSVHVESQELPKVVCLLPGSLLGSEARQGDFVAFVSNSANERVVARVRDSFCATNPGIKAAAITMPAWVPGIDWSDHKPFIEKGIPALMVTDTAPNRYPYYHMKRDKPEALRRSAAAYARVVAGMYAVIERLLDE